MSGLDEAKRRIADLRATSYADNGETQRAFRDGLQRAELVVAEVAAELDACRDCGRPNDYGCHDLCPALPAGVVLTLPNDEPPF